jgi:hypothetical protein
MILIFGSQEVGDYRRRRMRKDQSAICLHSWILSHSLSPIPISTGPLLTHNTAICSHSIRELCHRLPCRRQVRSARVVGYRWTRRLRALATTCVQPSPRTAHSLLHLKSRLVTKHHNQVVRQLIQLSTYFDVFTDSHSY